MNLPPIERVLADLGASLLRAAGDGLGQVAVREAAISIPLEATLGTGGSLAGSLPRWRLSTGFEPILHRLHLKVGEVTGETR